jgi:hypothetical protein
MNDDDTPPNEQAEVIDLHARRLTNFRYAELLRGVRQRLEELDEDILGDASQLAMAGAWEEWADAQPVGAEVHVTEQMLLECTDPNVHGLVRLAHAVRTAHEALHAPRPGKGA